MVNIGIVFGLMHFRVICWKYMIGLMSVISIMKLTTVIFHLRYNTFYSNQQHLHRMAHNTEYSQCRLKVLIMVRFRLKLSLLMKQHLRLVGTTPMECRDPNLQKPEEIMSEQEPI